MANATETIEQLFAGPDCRGIGGGRQWASKGRCRGRQWREGGFPAKLEREHATYVARVARFVRSLTLHQRICAAPARQHGNVLLAVDLVGDRSRHRRGLNSGRPQFLTVIGAIGAEVAGSIPLNHKVPCGGQYSAVPWAQVVSAPRFLLVHRIPGEYVALDIRLEGRGSGGVP